MTRLAAHCLALLFLLPTPFAAADTPLERSIDAALAPLFKPDWPGAIVMVTRDGQPVFRKAYGLANVQERVPMQPDMLLRVGSITKQFTAVAILMLAERGKLSLQDDVRRHLPDFPDKGKRITIEHLLQHTSGIPNYTALKSFRNLPDAGVTLSQVLDVFRNEPLDFAPGERFSYSNSGYFLLGLIVEKASGQRYQDFIAQNMLEPLGMRDTAHEGAERSARRIVKGHRLAGGAIVAVADIDATRAYAAGALVSTADDMARWDAAIAAGKLLKPATWRQAFTPCRTAQGACHYGYGWNIGTLAGRPLQAHGGSIPGFTAQSLRLPDDKVYVAVLTNGNGGAVNTPLVAYRAAAIAIGKPFPDYRALTLAPEALDAFVGEYRSEDKTLRTVQREGDRLLLKRAGREPVALQPHAPDAFFMQDAVTTIEFRRGADGTVVAMVLRQPPNDETAVRQ